MFNLKGPKAYQILKVKNFEGFLLTLKNSLENSPVSVRGYETVVLDKKVFVFERGCHLVQKQTQPPQPTTVVMVEAWTSADEARQVLLDTLKSLESDQIPTKGAYWLLDKENLRFSFYTEEPVLYTSDRHLSEVIEFKILESN